MGFQLPNPQLVSWTPEFWTRGPDRVYLEKLRPDREDVWPCDVAALAVYPWVGMEITLLVALCRATQLEKNGARDSL